MTRIKMRKLAKAMLIVFGYLVFCVVVGAAILWWIWVAGYVAQSMGHPQGAGLLVGTLLLLFGIATTVVYITMGAEE